MFGFERNGVPTGFACCGAHTIRDFASINHIGFAAIQAGDFIGVGLLVGGLRLGLFERYGMTAHFAFHSAHIWRDFAYINGIFPAAIQACNFVGI